MKKVLFVGLLLGLSFLLISSYNYAEEKPSKDQENFMKICSVVLGKAVYEKDLDLIKEITKKISAGNFVESIVIRVDKDELFSIKKNNAKNKKVKSQFIKYGNAEIGKLEIIFNSSKLVRNKIFYEKVLDICEFTFANGLYSMENSASEELLNSLIEYNSNIASIELSDTRGSIVFSKINDIASKESYIIDKAIVKKDGEQVSNLGKIVMVVNE